MTEKQSKKEYCHIWGNYYLDVDKYQFMLYEQKISETGKSAGEPYYVSEGNYTKAEDMIDRILRLEFSKDLPKDLVELLKVGKESLKYIKEKIAESTRDIKKG